MGVRTGGAVAAALAVSCAATPRSEWLSTGSALHPLVGRVWSMPEGRFVEPAEVEARVRAASLLLLGETHDNPDHYRLQAEALSGFLAEPGRAVVLEMVDEARQLTLDTPPAGDVDALGRALAWDESGWPPWAMYRPVFVAAVAGGARLVGAGLGRERSMSLARGTGALDPAIVARHGLDEPLPPELEAKLSQEIHEGHCKLMPESMLPGMLRVQRARDAVMAEHLLASPRGAALIAGAGHVRRDYGVPRYLARAERAALVIAFVEVDDARVEPAEYLDGPTYDLVWFTPRGSDVDHCAELEKQLKGHAPAGR